MPVHKTVLAAAAPDALPVAPEYSEKPLAGGRRRLAKAFERPLDKLLREPARVRRKVTLRVDDYATLVDLQQRLAAAGLRAKKSALLRAGLRLLATYDDAAFAQALKRLGASDA